MEKKEEFPLNNKEIFPSDEVIFSIISDKKIVWQGIMDYISQNYKDAAGEWRYYNDGKQWLFKMVLKKKTIFWIGICENTFRITFYFADKYGSAIEESNLPQVIKENFRNMKLVGKIKPITTKISGSSDLDNIFKLIDLKVKLK